VASEFSTIIRHGSVYLLANLAQRAAGFIMIPIYTNCLTEADYGTIALLTLVAEAIGILTGFRVSSAMYRFYFEYDDQKDRDEVVTTTYILYGGVPILFVALVAPAAPFLASLVLKDTAKWSLIVICLGGLALSIPIEITYNLMRLLRRSAAVSAASVSSLVMSLGLNILFVAVLRLGVEGVLWSTLLANLAIAAFFVLPVLRRYRFRFSRPKARELLRFGLPAIPGDLAGFSVHASDRFFLSQYWGVGLTGLYSLGHRFGNLIHYFITSPFIQIWLPYRFEIYKERADAPRFFARVFTYFTALMLFAGLGLSLLAREVIEIIAKEGFWPASRVVPIIALAYIIFAARYHLETGIYIGKKMGAISVITFAAALFNLGCNFVFIPWWKDYGAAFAALATMALNATLHYLVGNRLYPIPLEWRRLATAVAVAVGLYLGLNTALAGLPLIARIATKSAGSLSYPLLLACAGFFSREELGRAREGARALLARIRGRGGRPAAASGSAPDPGSAAGVERVDASSPRK